MKVKFETCFRIGGALLLFLLLWTIWSSAQAADTANTNSSVAAAKSAPAANEEPLATQRPYLTFGLNRVEVLQYETLGIPLWQYLAAFIYIVLAFWAARLIDYLIGGKLKKWAGRTDTRLDDVLLQLIHGPIKVICFVIFLHIGLRAFRWPAAVHVYFAKGLHIVVAISLTYLVLKAIDVLLAYWKEKSAGSKERGFNEQLLPFVRNSLKVFIVIVAVLLTADNLGLKITGLLASLSVGGLAVGLAAQDTLANLFGAIAVFVDKPFRVGDRIRLDNVEGEVESIGMRSTRVRNADGFLVTIPNKTVGNATITNIALRPTIRTVMNIGLTYDTPTVKVRRATELLQEIYRSHPMTKDVVITFNRFADSSLNIEVVHFWNSTDNKAYLQGLQELNLRVKDRFDAEHIEFAFPTQTLHFKGTESAPVSLK